LRAAAQKDAASAHVAESEKVPGEQQAFSEDFPDGGDVLGCRNASQQDNVGLIAHDLSESQQIQIQRQSVVGILGVDGSGRNPVKVAQGYYGFWQHQSRPSNNLHASDASGRILEFFRVIELPAKIQAADKSVHLAQWCPGVSESEGKVRFSG
jgi:hypothetical protein